MKSRAAGLFETRSTWALTISARSLNVSIISEDARVVFMKPLLSADG
jgi:hypothetical protein